MKRRLDSPQAVIVPWEVPDIAAASKAGPSHAFLELELGQADVSNVGSRPATAPEPNGLAAGAGSAVTEVITDPRLSAGYTEGYELGLAEGRERGYADGIAAGRQAVERQVDDQLRRFEAVLQRLGEPMRSLERPVEEAVIALALEVARWVTGNEIGRSRDYLVQLIRDAVAKVPIDVGSPTIVLNPVDTEMIRRLAPDLERNGIALVSEETMEPGGCRVIANDVNGVTTKDRRWHPGAIRGLCEVDLTLASRWREAMFAMFEGEDA